MKKIYTTAILLWTVIDAQGQTQLPSGLSGTIDENYIYTRTYLEPKTQSDSNAKQIQAIQYFDGLGRAKQLINIKASPKGRDIVTPFTYDYYGKPTRDYLPVPQSGTQDGKIYIQNSLAVDFPVGDPSGIYTGERPFVEKVLEKSPLDRIEQQIQEGNAWLNKPVTFDYKSISANDGMIKKYTTVTKWQNGTTNSEINLVGSYGIGQLYKYTVTDEDGNKSVTFQDSQGKVILVRKMINATDSADTYYVYNEYNQLAYVIPPKASIANDINSVINTLCYVYRYDEKNRVVMKRLPGKDFEYMVYDKADRLIMSQDGVMGASKQWIFIKYDQFGRTAYTGIYTSSQIAGPQGREVEQGLADGLESNYVKRTSSVGFTDVSGMQVYYENNALTSYPNTNIRILSIDYYDTYPQGAPVFANTFSQFLLTDDTSQLKTTKGLTTASFIKNIENDNWTKNYSYYDIKGRIIGTHSINHLGGFTKTESQLDFTGITLKTNTNHMRRIGETEVVIRERFDYDDQNRLLKHYHQVDSKPEELLADNTYNELLQLSNKKVGNNLQSIDYTYNIRGWLTDINKDQMSLDNLAGKLFSYKIKYNEKEGISNPDPNTFPNRSVVARYNGDITEVDWRSVETIGVNPSLTPKRYGYVYDGINRLIAGFYQNPYNPNSRENSESVDYDLNGNISTLYRSSVVETGTTATAIDRLRYIYADGGNKLTNVIDDQHNSNGYEGGGNLIAYDLNGNMTSMKDKKIEKINYNFLNLQNKIEYTNAQGLETSYFYRSDGVKIQKIYPIYECGFASCYYVPNITDYLDGFQYVTQGSPIPIGGGSESFSVNQQTNKAMEMQAYSVEESTAKVSAVVSSLKFFPTTEGFYDYERKQYIYHYTDHLGNTRISFGRNSAGVLEITDVNDYYPFGMNHLNTGSAIFGQNTYKNYKYNGKELQESGMYDYGARMYMPDLGRWGTIDPLSETSRRWAPYNYGHNNPIRFIDPDGRQENDVILRGDKAKEAFLQLQNAAKNLNLKMDSNGKVTGSVKKGAIATLAESTLLTATRDRSVLVEAIAQSSNVVESDNTAIFGGAFRGSKTTSSIDSSIEGSPNKLTHATQIINPTDLGIMDVFYDAIKGVGVFHEILEAYNGAVDSPGTVNMVGARNRTISYDSYISAHEKANQQDPRINYNLKSNNGPVSRSADGTIRINREIYKDVNGIRQTKPLGVVEIKPKIK